MSGLPGAARVVGRSRILSGMSPNEAGSVAAPLPASERPPAEAAVATISFHLIEKPSIAARLNAERWLEREFGAGNRRADAQPEGRREVPSTPVAA